MGFRVGPQKNVRILLVGERSVGKTSLILSLVSEEFPEDVPPKAEEITIPADVTPEQVPTHIVDYSAVEQSDEILYEEMKKAHVICVVYSVEDEDSLDKVTSKWLPLIRSTLAQSYCPVILVGNKVDLVEYSTIEAVYHVMEEYPEIESCVECSAKTLKNISEMFYYAQKAVLHPTLPLYLMEKQDLTDDCKNALIRIFKICDLDNDGLLNDYELNTFQRRCFNAPLQPQVLEDVKAVLRRNISDGVEGESITLSGFLFLHCLFIQRGRNETTWTVLRKFGYDDNLRMTKEYLRPLLRIPAGASTELSIRGIQFLYWLFERHDNDKDRALNPKEIQSLFSCCPKPAWEDQQLLRMVPTTGDGWPTMQGYICYWVYTTLVDVGRTLEYFAYLGYPIMENDSQITAIQVTREKRLDLQKKQTSRNVYQCAVTGASGVGKSAFCRGFLGHRLPQLFDSGESERQCCTNVVQVYGQEKYLVLREMDIREAIVEGSCDAACLIYDINDPKSFEPIAKMYLKHFADSKIPVLIVAAKSDLADLRQDYILQPTAFCSRHRLPPPQPFSSASTSTVSRDVYVKLATMAAFPHLKQLGLMPGDSLGWLKAGLGLVAATAVGFLVVRVLRNSEHR